MSGKAKMIPSANVLVPGPGYTMEPNGKGGFDIKPAPDIAWPASRSMGRLGGMAGTGKAKARDSKTTRAAARKRWDKKRKAK